MEVLRRCKRPDAGANPHGTMGAEELERGMQSVCAIGTSILSKFVCDNVIIIDSR